MAKAKNSTTQTVIAVVIVAIAAYLALKLFGGKKASGKASGGGGVPGSYAPQQNQQRPGGSPPNFGGGGSAPKPPASLSSNAGLTAFFNSIAAYQDNAANSPNPSLQGESLKDYSPDYFSAAQGPAQITDTTIPYDPLATTPAGFGDSTLSGESFGTVSQAEAMALQPAPDPFSQSFVSGLDSALNPNSSTTLADLFSTPAADFSGATDSSAYSDPGAFVTDGNNGSSDSYSSFDSTLGSSDPFGLGGGGYSDPIDTGGGSSTDTGGGSSTDTSGGDGGGEFS
jgi:hypothetical protein